MTRPAFLFLFVCVPAAAFSHPQTPGPAAQPQALTLDQAIQYATDHYPSIRAVLEQATASAAGVDVARSAYLPRLDAMWQSNRATVNNVFGQVLPQGVHSRPLRPGAARRVESKRLGQRDRRAAVLGASRLRASARRSGAAPKPPWRRRAPTESADPRRRADGRSPTRFSPWSRRSARSWRREADLERRTLLLDSVQVLVDNQLRPGVDASRAEAERAAAQIAAHSGPPGPDDDAGDA